MVALLFFCWIFVIFSFPVVFFTSEKMFSSNSLNFRLLPGLTKVESFDLYALQKWEKVGPENSSLFKNTLTHTHSHSIRLFYLMNFVCRKAWTYQWNKRAAFCVHTELIKIVGANTKKGHKNIYTYNVHEFAAPFEKNKNGTIKLQENNVVNKLWKCGCYYICALVFVLIWREKKATVSCYPHYDRQHIQYATIREAIPKKKKMNMDRMTNGSMDNTRMVKWKNHCVMVE